MKCNLASPTLLSILPASSLAPLALGAFAIASALAMQRLEAEPRRGGRHGRRSRGRTGTRTDRRAEKEGRHRAPSAAVGLPEATAEIIASLGEHRVLSTEQVRAIHLPGRSLRRTQQILAGIEEAGLIHHVDSRVAPRSRRRRRTLFADAILAYQRHEEDGTALELRFLELDRATLSVDRLVVELSRYAQLYRATDAKGESLWRNRYPVFPRVLCVLTGASRKALATRRTFAAMLLREHPAMEQARGEVSISFCRLEDLQRKGPFAPIFREVRDRERPVDWLGDSPDDEEER